MSKDSKMGNLLKFTEYDHLQPKQSPTKYTEIGGYSILEGLSIKELLKIAKEKSGKSKKELKKLTPKELKKLCGEKCNGTGEEGKSNLKKDENVSEAKRKRELSWNDLRYRNEYLVKNSKEEEEEEQEKLNKMRGKVRDDEEKKKYATTTKDMIYRDDNLVEEKASAKQKAARAKFMEMINKKKGNKKEDKSEKPNPFKSFKKKDKK